MIELHDFTKWAVGEDDLKGGCIAPCPACGRPARIDRYTPFKNLHPAHYVHKVWLDDETLARHFDRCYIEVAPRSDGLGHEEAAVLHKTATSIRMLSFRLASALNGGWYKAPSDGWHARHYVAQLRAVLAALPALTEADDGR